MIRGPDSRRCRSSTMSTWSMGDTLHGGQVVSFNQLLHPMTWLRCNSFITFKNINPVIVISLPTVMLCSLCYLDMEHGMKKVKTAPRNLICCANSRHSLIYILKKKTPNAPVYVENRNICVKSTMSFGEFCQETLSHRRHLHFTPFWFSLLVSRLKLPLAALELCSAVKLICLLGHFMCCLYSPVIWSCMIILYSHILFYW